MEFEPARWPKVRLAAFGLAMVAGSTALFLLPEMAVVGINLLDVLGWVGLAIFIPATTYAVVRAVRPCVALRLTPEGFSDESSVSAVGFVPWEQVAAVGTLDLSGHRNVAVYLHDPEAFIAGLDPYRKLTAQTNLRMFGSPVWINRSGLPPADDLSALIDVYRRGWALHQAGAQS